MCGIDVARYRSEQIDVVLSGYPHQRCEFAYRKLIEGSVVQQVVVHASSSVLQDIATRGVGERSTLCAWCGCGRCNTPRHDCSPTKSTILHCAPSSSFETRKRRFGRKREARCSSGRTLRFRVDS